ncbi:MAG: sigma-54-dependent Fis family transcriptional regulator [Ignavibacteriales bacterium]|nr:sigma-54-dependent Fis family transcriptional regulator [Ignavibacteriales bacterium]
MESLQQQYGIIGDSIEIKEILNVVRQVAPTDITVLITGESGTGKEVIAKTIHRLSRRASKPIISVNAGAIPEGIIESELFGHEKGAFTGAGETRKGYFELADGGTIFLDEIGELPTGTQVKFLRVLESGEYMRVGSATPRKADVRIIAATNKDLETEVRHGICEKNNITFGGFTEEAKELIKNYYWPGNVRELKNIVESMLVIERGKRIDADDVRKYLKYRREDNRNLPVYTHKSLEEAERELILRALLEMKNDIMEIKDYLRHGNGSKVDSHYVEASFDTSNPDDGPPIEPVSEIERRAIIGALDRFKGNRRLASRALNISERTLYRKIKEYKLEK